MNKSIKAQGYKILMHLWLTHYSALSRGYSTISHANAYKANAVMIMKTTIEPNKAAVSLIKLPAVIVGSFVAL